MAPGLGRRTNGCRPCRCALCVRTYLPSPRRRRRGEGTPPCRCSRRRRRLPPQPRERPSSGKTEAWSECSSRHTRRKEMPTATPEGWATQSVPMRLAGSKPNLPASEFSMGSVATRATPVLLSVSPFTLGGVLPWHKSEGLRSLSRVRWGRGSRRSPASIFGVPIRACGTISVPYSLTIGARCALGSGILGRFGLAYIALMNVKSCPTNVNWRESIRDMNENRPVSTTLRLSIVH
jgi:hypothetical protein